MNTGVKQKEAVEIIDYIVNVTSLANKWLMWCESNGPERSVFVPSIFQMRDAYSHIIKLMGNGIENKIDDMNLLFNNEYSIKQLEEAFSHCARAFYDCADYILLIVKEEIDQKGKTTYLDLRSKLLKNDTYINELRSAKSEDIIGSYENIKKWDLFLQLITSSYVFGDFHIELIKAMKEIKTKLTVIENKFSSEIIKNHSPQFYEEKKILIELEELPQGWVDYIRDDSIVSEHVLENSQAWSENIVQELKEKIEKAHEYSAHLDGLQKVMLNSNVIQKRKTILKSVWGVISMCISWIITNFMSSTFMVNLSLDTTNQTQTVVVDRLNLHLLLPFIAVCAIVFLIGCGIFKLIYCISIRRY